MIGVSGVLAAMDEHDGHSGEMETPGQLAQALMPSTVQTPALELIDRELIQAVEASERGEQPRLMIFMPPQEGKSERVSHYFPLWLLRRNHDLRIAIVSFDKSTAERWGRDIRNDINNFDGSDEQIDLGLRLRKGSKSAGRWQLDDHRGGLYCVGVDGALTGRPVDVLIVDDPIKGLKEARSDVIREQAKAFWRGSAITRLAPNAIVIVIQTRWHEDDLSGWLLTEARNDPNRWQWRTVNIPAQAERIHDEHGNPLPNALPDGLNRPEPEPGEEGEFMISSRGRTVDQWRHIKAEAGAVVWAALYQQRPAPEDGIVFLRKWWNYYDLPRAAKQPDGSYRVLKQGQVIQSWDCSFKDTDGSDYVVGMILQRVGMEVSVLDLVADRMDLVSTCDAMRQLTAKWPQAKLKLVEDKANGPSVIAAMNKEVGGVVAYNPQGSKLARAYAIQPFAEARNFWLPSPHRAPWVSHFVNELASFPNAANDDHVDAFTQGVNRLLLNTNPTQEYMESLFRDRGLTALPGGRSG